MSKTYHHQAKSVTTVEQPTFYLKEVGGWSDQTFGANLILANTSHLYFAIEEERKRLGLAYPTVKPFDERKLKRLASFIRSVYQGNGSPVGVSFRSIARDWLED